MSNPGQLRAYAIAQLEAGKLTEAATACRQLLSAAPQDFGANHLLGVILSRLGQGVEARACLDRCIAIYAGEPKIYFDRAILRIDMADITGAIDDFGAALRLQPDMVPARLRRAKALQSQGRYSEAIIDLKQVEKIAPEDKYLLGAMLTCALDACDWQVIEELRARIEVRVNRGEAVIAPLIMAFLSDDPALLQASAKYFLSDLRLTVAEPPAVRTSGGRMRIAYLSGDYFGHAVASLFRDLIGRHDRARFEIIGVSFGPDDGSNMRAWLMKTFVRFIDARGLSDAQVADMLRQSQIDIAVDLTGYTRNARAGILALRPAAVQVNYLGFPGTMEADFIDYMIGDPVVVPRELQQYYGEKIAYLPDSYQANDPERPRPSPPSRAEAGLPPEGFVFCSFGAHRKITQPMFDIWMRLLNAVPGSVLWLLDGGARETLRVRALAHGVDPVRLIFAPPVLPHLHLARHGLADLVLDTFPYNGHTTTSDALWMEVPVVTYRGRAFASRVASSLLNADEVGELITENLKDYETIALNLAQDDKSLQALRAKLAAKRLSAPLFDAARFCRNMEAAFTTMIEIARRGEAPRSFAVPEQSLQSR